MPATRTIGTGKDFATNQAAIDDVPGNLAGQGIQTHETYAGGTVVANGWRYDENLDFDAGFSNADTDNHLEANAMVANQGKPGYGIIINAQGYIIKPGDYLKFDGYGLTYAGTSNANIEAIRTNGVSHQTICNCVIYHLYVAINCTAYGICDLVGASNSLIYNNILSDFNVAGGGTNHVIGIYSHTSTNSKIYNNSICNIVSAASGVKAGINIYSSNGLEWTNNVVTNVPGGTCFKNSSGNNPTITYCISSDDSADDAGGAGNLINKAAADQFINATVGSEDLHLKEGADCLSAGTDLSGTFTDDIDGDTRSNWDVGADEYQAAAAGCPRQAMYYKRMRR